ncbi:hypothetical protein [Paenibacillus eucommiae]|uniref:Phage protein n=1 Tax=Paenibacillus eucommiae TaxID=1355755 RepID=A0ABS4J0C2_9BACL|nr:hypothetical protein [Paenibacillus eucommiae]MBP1992561.1 hypothetical protein [Paenibacillus eucommiae]
MNQIMLEMAIGRQLTELELKVMNWVNGWELETSGALMGLIMDAQEAGFQKALNNR